jgi:N-acetylneuraminic acid mutarotase
MPAAIILFAACAIDGDIYVFGGFSEAFNNSIQASVFKYSTEEDEWSILAPMPCACRYHSAQVLNGLVHIVGADSGSAVLRFDPATDVWSTLARSSVSRVYGSSFILNGMLYTAGGERAPSSVERYDMASNTWTTVADMLEGRQYFAAVTVAFTGPAEE